MSRVKQFVLDLLSPLRRLDEDYVQTYLNEKERTLFYKLRKAEQLHAIVVAKATMAEIGSAKLCSKPELIAKACLLHDVGKHRYAMGPLSKTYVALFGKRLGEHLSNLSQKPRLDIYFNHGSYGEADLRGLNSFEGQEYFYDLVGLHHKPDAFYAKYQEENIRRIFQTYKAMDDAN